jgi:hypothetical protein
MPWGAARDRVGGHPAWGQSRPGPGRLRPAAALRLRQTRADRGAVSGRLPGAGDALFAAIVFGAVLGLAVRAELGGA